MSAQSLKDFAASLRELPKTLAIKVATAAAPALTDAANATFNAGQDAYGVSWDPLEDGSKATLRKSGALAGKIRYVAVGTRLRLALGVAHAKYVIGRRPVYPKQGEPLPAAYTAALKSATDAVIRAELGR